MNRCVNPFSALDGSSTTCLATLGWVKPPTVKYVEGIENLASPVTKVHNIIYYM